VFFWRPRWVRFRRWAQGSFPDSGVFLLDGAALSLGLVYRLSFASTAQLSFIWSFFVGTLDGLVLIIPGVHIILLLIVSFFHYSSFNILSVGVLWMLWERCILGNR
jgi:hypothetical protein